MTGLCGYGYDQRPPEITTAISKIHLGRDIVPILGGADRPIMADIYGDENPGRVETAP